MVGIVMRRASAILYVLQGYLLTGFQCGGFNYPYRTQCYRCRTERPGKQEGGSVGCFIY